MVSFFPSICLCALQAFYRAGGQLSPANMAHAGREQHRAAALNLCNKTLPNIRSAQASRPFGLGMGENILGGEAGKIEPYPLRQEAKTRRGELVPPLARQHGVEPLLKRM